MAKHPPFPEVPPQVDAFFNAVKNNPFLKGHADGIPSFSQLPPLDKAALKTLIEQNFHPQEEEKGVFYNRTGGTLGEALFVPICPSENRRQRKLLAEHLLNAGILSPKTIGLNLFVYKNMYRPASIFDDVLDDAGATSIGVGDAIPDDFALKFIHQFGVNMLIGTPSRIFQFATYLLENHIHIEIPAILFSGELLPESYREVIERTLHTKNIYAVFGATEIGIWGYADYGKNGPLYKMIPEIGYMEIENPDKEGFGPIVITNVLKSRFPVLRYKNHDMARLIHKPDGLYFELKGRGEFVFRIGSSFLFEHDFKGVTKHADQYQIQLSYVGHLITKVTLLLVKESVTDMDTYLKNNTEELHKVLAKLNSEFVPEIAVVKASELLTHPVTGKTPLLMDLRH